MKDASQFPITFPYGAVDNEFYGKGGSVGQTHRGEDRAMPKNTPIIINGNTTIGSSGNSGSASSGFHLHIGRFVNGQATNPNGQGFNLKAPAKVTGVFEDTTNGKYVTINDADGVRFVYLHLNSQTATIGQIINKQEEEPTMNEGDVTNMYRVLLGREPEQNGFTAYVGKPWKEAIYSITSSAEYNGRIENMQQAVQAGQLQKVRDDKTIAELQKQLEMVDARTNAAITVAAKSAPASTKQPWYVRLVAALTSKK